MQTLKRAMFGGSACIIGLFAGGAYADETAIREFFKRRLPAAQVLSIQRLPHGGLYEIAVRRDGETLIYYTDSRANVVLVGGNLIETATDRSLTEERLRQLTAIDWKGLPFRLAITTRRGDGRRQIAIFSDPNCPYCKKFEKDLAALDNIVIHIFMYPVVRPESVAVVKSVWCSKDRAKAWNDLMLKNIEPTASSDCENPVEELIALGRRLGATSTPTWYLPNGQKHTGAQPMGVVVPLLDATARR